MKKIFANLILITFIISLMGMASCKNRAAEKEKKAFEMEEVKKIEGEIEKNVYPLPTSAEVIKLLTDLEVGYNLGAGNFVTNVNKYFESNKKAINLGVYGADLSYATLYNMNQQVIDYMGAIRTLANDLNMSKIYNEELYDSIKVNFDNKDKLVSILTDAFNETYTYLSENEQQGLALLVVGGAWVEGMYITTQISEAAYHVSGISKVLIEQKNSFELYLEITEPYLSDPIVADFVKKLDPIKQVYSGLTTSLTEKNINDITAAITDIRTQIVQ
ncbi:MAG TPA: hypothetical protein VHO50_07580 [Bacteroidales bacterium]|nr:hypothetical protein [Bacteroidales bacterium]